MESSSFREEPTISQNWSLTPTERRSSETSVIPTAAWSNAARSISSRSTPPSIVFLFAGLGLRPIRASPGSRSNLIILSDPALRAPREPGGVQRVEQRSFDRHRLALQFAGQHLGRQGCP